MTDRAARPAPAGLYACPVCRTRIRQGQPVALLMRDRWSSDLGADWAHAACIDWVEGPALHPQARPLLQDQPVQVAGGDVPR